MLRRNSLVSFSRKLIIPPTNPNSSLFLLRFSSSIINHARSSSTIANTPSSSTAAVADSAKLGFRDFGSAATIETTSSLAALSVSKAVDVVRHYGQCYWELSKARLSMLVVATSGAGYVLGSGSAIDFLGLSCTCAGTMMVAASSNSLNQVFEIKNDAKMKRTMRRPLPSGRITLPHAVTWASSVGVAGTALLAWKANMLAAGLGASNLVLYAFVYTPLKQIHPVNTWVGAVVGAIPPLLGWVAASGQVSLNGMILPAALYFWQIPHFMALAYLCREDYAAGGKLKVLLLCLVKLVNWLLLMRKSRLQDWDKTHLRMRRRMNIKILRLDNVLRLLLSYILSSAQCCPPLSGVEGSLESHLNVLGERERWNVDILFRLLTGLLPYLHEKAVETCPFPSASDAEGELFSTSLLELYAGGCVEWPTLEWLHCDCFPTLIQCIRSSKQA